MLQWETLPPSLAGLLFTFRWCFTGPSFRTFSSLVAGMVAQPGRRTVVGMLVGAGLARAWHWSRAHWFFGRARWDVDEVSLLLLRLIVERLLDPGAAITVAVDDTLFRRAGRKVHAAGWHHDGAANAPTRKRLGWGNNWVIAGIVVDLPMRSRPMCLPVGAVLWTTTAPSKQALACRLVTAIAAAYPDRQVHVVADAWYAGADGAPGAAVGAARHRGLPAGVTLTSRLRANAALYAIATPVPGAAGRPRRIGAKLGNPSRLAATATWQPATVTRYGKTGTVHIAVIVCLWYGVYRSRAIRVILIREPGPTPKTGYHHTLISTDLHSDPADLITRYATRWSIETAIEDAKQHTGVGQAHNRTPQAVHRTVPFGLTVQSLTICWYTLHGYHPDDAANRRRDHTWYTTKTEPTYQDMIIKLRRTLIAARFLDGNPRQPTPDETRAVHAAWANAAA